MAHSILHSGPQTADVSNHRYSSATIAVRLLLLVVMVSACLALLQSVPLVRLPYQIDFGEGLMLEGAQRVQGHQPLYPSPYAFPIVLHDWGPVAYAAATLAMSGGNPSFPAGRVLVVICSVLLATLVTLILKRWTGSLWTGLAFGLLLLTLPGFRFWLYLLRIDVIAVVLSTLGVLLYARNERHRYWAVPFFVLAIFCKYTLIAAPAAVFVHLLFRRRIREGIGFAAALSLICLMIFTLLQAATGGWFAFHMFGTHSDRYSALQFLALAALVWASAPVVTGLAVWYVVHQVRGRQRSFASIYFVTSLVTSLSAGQLGSTTNHFLEWMVASCLCAGLGYSELASKLPKRFAPVTALLSVSVLAGAILQGRSSLQPAAGLAECDRAYETIRNSPSRAILAQSPGPLVATGKPVMVSDPFVYSQLVKHGRWPDTRIEQLVNERYFGLIVMAEDPSLSQPAESGWPEVLRADISANYRVTHRYVCRDASVMLEPIVPAAAGVSAK